MITPHAHTSHVHTQKHANTWIDIWTRTTDTCTSLQRGPLEQRHTHNGHKRTHKNTHIDRWREECAEKGNEYEFSFLGKLGMGP